MKYQEKVSTREDVRRLYERVKNQPTISQYRGYTQSKSYGWDEFVNDYIKADGELWFDNPSYDPNYFAPTEGEQTMNKQIEEMASILCPQHNNGKCVVYGKCEDNCSFREDYKRLYNAGYRKSTDVAREIFEEIEKFLKSQEALSENKRLKEVGDWIFHDYLPSQFAELKKKYESEGADDGN